MDRAIADGSARFGGKAPVEAWIGEGFEKTRGCGNIGMSVTAARLDQKDGNARIFGEPVGQHASRRPSADDDVVNRGSGHPDLSYKALGRALILDGRIEIRHRGPAHVAAVI